MKPAVRSVTARTLTTIYEPNCLPVWTPDAQSAVDVDRGLHLPGLCLAAIGHALAGQQSADERLANARSAVFNIVRAAEQHATDTVRQADSTLKNIAERIEVDGWGRRSGCVFHN